MNQKQDNHGNNNHRDDNIDINSSIMFNNKNNVWVDDVMVSRCYNCKKKFSMLRRKHHCRNCGNIFCYNCANKFIVIPNFINDRPEPADYWNISYYITSLKDEAERVCDNCYYKVKEKTANSEKIANILKNPGSIVDISKLSVSYSDIKDHYYNHLRNIQYYLPNHVYSQIDKKIILANAKYFSKHSKYLVHLIKAIDWNTIKITDDKFDSPSVSIYKNRSQHKQKFLDHICEIIENPKKVSCQDLLCTRTCQEQLSFDDCINILYSKVQELPDSLLQYLFAIIELTPDDIIKNHAVLFVNIIKNNSNIFLEKLLYKLLTKSEDMIYYIYWLLVISKEKADYQDITNIQRFIELLDKQLVVKMDREYRFYAGLIKHLNDPKDYLENIFDICDEISLPYNPSIKLTGVYTDQIRIKNSYTRPVIIAFETNVGRIDILFKKESVMNDLIVMNLISLCDVIIKENIGLELGIVVYPIMPLTNNFGMIEIIKNAETIHSIINQKKTVFQHIIDKNENKVISDIMKTYMYSLVSYTLHSYFIGLGDRHLENIMITDNGEIFHIDFGFILGTDAFPLTLTSDIKLNSGMLDVIGGRGSDRYKIYLDLCAKGVIILRKYFNMFFILLSQNSNYKINHIENFIMSRFQPRQHDTVVISELMTIIEKSHDAYTGIIRDFLHYHNQEKTLQNGMTKVLKEAYDVVKSFTNST